MKSPSAEGKDLVKSTRAGVREDAAHEIEEQVNYLLICGDYYCVGCICLPPSMGSVQMHGLDRMGWISFIICLDFIYSSSIKSNILTFSVQSI